MVERHEVSKDFGKQVFGYGLTTAEIVCRGPDRHWLLQITLGRTTICFQICRR
jgi:uncharacterized protein Usg